MEITGEHDNFGWTSDAATAAHAYLLPAVLKTVTALRSRAHGLRVLDIGCGNGHVAAHLATLGCDVVGIDIASDGIAIARARNSAARFERLSIYDAQFADLIATPFDCVISLEVIEHLYSPQRLIVEARRALTPSGALVLSTPFHGYWKNLALSCLGAWDRHLDVGREGGHIKFFSARTLRRALIEGGFGTISIQGVGRLPGFSKSMVATAHRV
jgi:2-polyprenyl-3-methyl-5-hydroxy-6-metoxy-1,4-benzoquinol methylase